MEDESAKLSGGARVVRLGAIGAVVLGVTAGFAYAGGWLTPGRLTQTTVIDGFEAQNGTHIGFRRNHAKGLCAAGWFDSTGEGATFSKADVLASGRVPVIGRFAFAGGMPFIPDSPGLVRSLALQFKPPHGQEWRTAMIDLPLFPVANVQAFYAQMIASIPDRNTGKPDPEKMQAFKAAHPETVAAMAVIGKRAVSSGFSNDTYNALDTFEFVDKDGRSVPVRWSAVPAQPFSPAAPQDKQDPNYLFDALIADAAHHPLTWKMVATIGQPGDPVSPDLPWPEDRQHIDLGTVTLDKLTSEDVGPCTDINFDPTVLPAGISTSADAIPSARSAAYSRSFMLREKERAAKPPSAVTETDVLAGGKS
ncbi:MULTISPECIES: catalase family peroxidase [unclassified Cupriavidus]|uniref:catalase family peroxidase n=1 Tax=unclassified Cupriavidus TaxID=2640874 RepID=UPI0010F55150|nr:MULTISPECIES: catalase family peroxidase [unclassified Cupriavidus]MWL87755.1 catalase [Cupriavidus sp. SW-Y-13]